MEPLNIIIENSEILENTEAAIYFANNFTPLTNIDLFPPHAPSASKYVNDMIKIKQSKNIIDNIDMKIYKAITYYEILKNDKILLAIISLNKSKNILVEYIEKIINKKNI